MMLWNGLGHRIRRLGDVLKTEEKQAQVKAVANSQHKRFINIRKRFYKKVTIAKCNGMYEINLDNRKLKTPLGKVFQVPNEGLAIAVATEWLAQDKIVWQQNMHLTGLCNSAQDNPTQKDKSCLVDMLLNFLDTDTVCYRSDKPDDLAQLQRNQWDPILDWFTTTYRVPLTPSYELISSVVPPDTKQALSNHLKSYNFWALTGFHFAVETIKSFLLTLATVDRYLTIEQAVSLSRLEEEFQIANCGNIEWAHDVDLMQLRARLSAAIIFIHLNSNCSNIVQLKRS